MCPKCGGRLFFTWVIEAEYCEHCDYIKLVHTREDSDNDV